MHSVGECVGKWSLTQTVSICLGLRGFPGSKIFHVKKGESGAKQDELVNLNWDYKLVQSFWRVIWQ